MDTFEIHLTVPASTSKVVMEALATELSSKHQVHVSYTPLLLQMTNGVMNEMMFTTQISADGVVRAIYKAYELAESISEHGLEVLRRKVEVPFTFQGPDLKDFNPDGYCEVHIEVYLPNDSERQRVFGELCNEHGMFVSYNTRKIQDSGQVAICTIRSASASETGCPKHDMNIRLSACLASLDKSGFSVLEYQKEICYFDTNVEHDIEWLNTSIREVHHM